MPQSRFTGASVPELSQSPVSTINYTCDWAEPYAFITKHLKICTLLLEFPHKYFWPSSFHWSLCCHCNTLLLVKIHPNRTHDIKNAATTSTVTNLTLFLWYPYLLCLHQVHHLHSRNRTNKNFLCCTTHTDIFLRNEQKNNKSDRNIIKWTILLIIRLNAWL